MFASPSAMPSLLASPRCVTRESSETASSSLSSRLASTSKILLGDDEIVGIVDADRPFARHLVGDDAVAIQRGLAAGEQPGPARIDGAVHDPRFRKILPAVNPLANGISGNKQH